MSDTSVACLNTTNDYELEFGNNDTNFAQLELERDEQLMTRGYANVSTDESFTLWRDQLSLRQY